MIPQDKAEEYMQVAALLALDIDLLLGAARREALTAEQLRRLIVRLHEKKEQLIASPEVRRDRYGAAAAVLRVAGGM